MPQEDQHATELNHPEKVSRVTFPAAADPAKVLQPGEQPLNLPSPQVAAQRPPILGSLSAATVGGNHLDAMFAPQPLIQDEWQGETRLRVRLCGRSCSAVCTVRRMDARQMHAVVDSGCDENVHQMCERSNHGLCRLQRQSWHCGDARVMDVLLGLTHRWRWSGEPYIPVCPSVGKNLGELSTGDLP